MPHPASYWGNAGEAGIPPIVDDGDGYNVFEWFKSTSPAANFPLTIFIDHEMSIAHILDTSPTFTQANIMIQNLLDKIPLDNLSIRDDASPARLEKFRIRQLYPNPFNPSLTIDLYSFVSTAIDVDILSIDGKLIASLYSGDLVPGNHQLTWNASSKPAGIYLVSVLSGDGDRLVRKIVLLK
jgi:hypothetical protein